MGEEGRGGEDPQEIPRSCPRHCREITQSSYWRFGQEKVPGPLRSHCWSVLLPHQEEDQPQTRGCPVLLCQQRDPTHLRHHGVVVPGEQLRRSYRLGPSNNIATLHWELDLVPLTLTCMLLPAFSLANRPDIICHHHYHHS